MSAEDKFNEIILKLKAEINNYTEEAINSIHSEMLPYVNDDTESNAIYQAHDIVLNMLSGNFTLNGDEIVCCGWKTKLTDNDHDRLVNKLAEKCADEAMKKKVERLERQLVEEAYRSSY